MEKCNICGRKMTEEELEEYDVNECDDCQNSMYSYDS
jgi:DNA-directed RNA polymerase subunit RPC12/RpoP